METNPESNSLGDIYQRERKELIARRMSKLVDKLLKKAARARRRGDQSASITVEAGLSTAQLMSDVFDSAEGYLRAENLNPSMRKYNGPGKRGSSVDHYSLSIDWSPKPEEEETPSEN